MSNYSIVQLNNGAYQYNYQIQDGEEGGTSKTKEEAVHDLIRAVEGMNGNTITEGDICFGTQVPPKVQWNAGIEKPFSSDLDKRVEQKSFRAELSNLINCHSKENNSSTPDFILAEYLSDCLKSFDKAVKRRKEWYS